MSIERPSKSLRHSAQLSRIRHRIHVALGVLVGILIVGSMGFKLIGGHAYGMTDAFYMTLITVTTVGYSEVIPLGTTAARMFGGFIALVGFGNLTFLFTSLTVFFLESDLDLSLRRRRMEKAIKKLSSHYIVCGFGRVGRNVATELVATRRLFVAIDHVETQLDSLAEVFPDLLFLHGDASDDALLVAADIADAAGVFAVTGDDSLNLMITITAKQLNPKVRVVARCHEVRNIEKLRKAGADSVVSPDFTGGMRIASMMLRPHVVSFLDEMLRSEHRVRVEEFALPDSFRARSLAALELVHPDYVLIAIRTGKDWTFNPPGIFALQARQVLIVMASPQGRAAIEQKLRDAGRD
ncbi:MAG: TrkA-N protein [Rhodocyclales bacterium]|nr:TrkA-N protein [Rhodocyclales bacterium]